MGAWDAGPRKNDTALDHELHIFGCDGRDDIGPQNPDELRYVAWMVTQLKPDFPDLKDQASRSLVRMKELLCDTDWLAQWKKPNEVIDSITEQIAELEKLANPPKAPPICPRCGQNMDFIGSVGVYQADHEWDAETDRFDCPEGHTILVLDTNRIDEVEGYDKAEGHGLNLKIGSPSKLCETCKVIEHAGGSVHVCSMTDGCPCCEDTKQKLCEDRR